MAEVKTPDENSTARKPAARFIRAAAIAAILAGTLVPSFAGAAAECEQPFVNQPPDHFITLCSEVIRSNPEAAWAYNSRGHAYRVKGEADKAIANYNEAIRLNSKYAEAYYNRGVAYTDKREYDTAVADFNEAIRLNPQHSQAYKNRGVAYAGKREYDRAIADFKQAAQLDSAEVFGQCANSADPVQRIASCLEAAKATPFAQTLTWVHVNLARAYREIGKTEEAVTHYQASLRAQERDWVRREIEAFAR